MIKISKLNKETNEVEVMEYNSLNEATRQNGATASGRNREACLKYLEKVGFDLNTLEETAKGSRKQLGIVEKVAKMCKVVDKEKLKTLEKERTAIMKTATTTSDMEKILEINESIKSLQNPKITDKALKAKFTELVKEYRKAEKIELLTNELEQLETIEKPSKEQAERITEIEGILNPTEEKEKAE